MSPVIVVLKGYFFPFLGIKIVCEIARSLTLNHYPKCLLLDLYAKKKMVAAIK